MNPERFLDARRPDGEYLGAWTAHPWGPENLQYWYFLLNDIFLDLFMPARNWLAHDNIVTMSFERTVFSRQFRQIIGADSRAVDYWSVFRTEREGIIIPRSIEGAALRALPIFFFRKDQDPLRHDEHEYYTMLTARRLGRSVPACIQPRGD